jgi:LytS/YehU family sensor histidine kinase
LYLQLEKARLEDKLNYVIQIEDDLDEDLIEIPTMILQPFVENAINHGLFHKEGSGHLSIFIHKIDDNQIKVVIQDNGIGRKAAQEIKENNLKTHISRAMQIVKEKLEVLKADTTFKVSFEIEDLYDNKNEASGTKAIIYFSF